MPQVRRIWTLELVIRSPKKHQHGTPLLDYMSWAGEKEDDHIIGGGSRRENQKLNSKRGSCGRKENQNGLLVTCKTTR